jgi:hypothetical protein
VSEEQASDMELAEEHPTEEEQQELQEEVDEALKIWMTNNTQQSMREARMLRKFWVGSLNLNVSLPAGFSTCSRLLLPFNCE